MPPDHDAYENLLKMQDASNRIFIGSVGICDSAWEGISYGASAGLGHEIMDAVLSLTGVEPYSHPEGEEAKIVIATCIDLYLEYIK